MTRYIEKYAGIASCLVSFSILFLIKDAIDVNNLLSGFSKIIALFIVFLSTSALVLISNQGKKFIEIAKTSGAYQALLRYISKTIIFCMISIALVIFAKYFEIELLNLFAISACFGSLVSSLISEMLFIKLMKLKSVF